MNFCKNKYNTLSIMKINDDLYNKLYSCCSNKFLSISESLCVFAIHFNVIEIENNNFCNESEALWLHKQGSRFPIRVSSFLSEARQKRCLEELREGCDEGPETRMNRYRPPNSDMYVFSITLTKMIVTFAMTVNCYYHLKLTRWNASDTAKNWETAISRKLWGNKRVFVWVHIATRHMATRGGQEGECLYLAGWQLPTGL